MTYLCVPIFVDNFDHARRRIADAVKAGADMIELRVDGSRHTKLPGALTVFCNLARDAGVACIFTCRAEWEGGLNDLKETDRLALLADAARSGALGLVDVELAAAQHPYSEAAKLIISSHDFSSRPEKLYNILLEMNDLNADINKIAWTARSVRDNLEAFDILLHQTRPTIALCMGEAGMISRILAKKFGAFLTFASLINETETAPGQITIADMRQLYRWDALKPETRVFGVVAHPVGHSMSPAIHNAAFDATKYDGVYVPFLVQPGYESFKAFMESFLAFTPLDLSGLSVTLPHKENALRYLQSKDAVIEPLAARIGAVNTIVIQPGQPLRGLNTDYAAILDSITDAVNITREELATKRVAVIGAGGTGRTAVAALAYYGAQVIVYNRTPDRAKTLADEFSAHPGSVTAAPLEDAEKTPCDIYINTTSVGMHPNTAQTPINVAALPLSPHTLVFDTIYNPAKTLLLQQAEAAGAKTIGGIEMFLRQAVGQFEAWTCLPAPTQVMRQVIERRLAGK